MLRVLSHRSVLAAVACFTGLAPISRAQTPCAWQAQDNLVVFEVEVIDPVGDWIEVTDNAGYTGDSFFRWNGPNFFNNPGNGILEYEFEVHEAGTYQLRIRNRHNHPDDTEENDCWTRVDGGQWFKTYSNGSGTVGQWVMKTNFDLNPNYPTANYTLDVGRHVLQISGRSHNFMIDRVHFYKPPVPNAEDPNQPQSACGLGGNYCDASVNSTGFAATMDALGSVSVADNNLTLRARGVPQQPGIIFYGTQTANQPFGDGTRCVGGTTFRLPVTLPQGSSLVTTLDLTNPPQGGQITAGSTFHFQAWYRDPAAGGAGFNLSDGLHVNFLP